MAGYSGTPLAKKLGIKSGHRVGLINAPAGFESALEGLPADARVSRTDEQTGVFDVVVCFFTERAEFQASFDALTRRIEPDGGLWTVWPKKSSGMSTGLTEDVLRKVGLPTGMVDNKVCAVDETWSGLRFVWRLENRPGAGRASRRRNRDAGGT